MRLYGLLVCLIMISTSAVNPGLFKQKEPMKLLYVYDPLCGWCYGFGPVVERIEKEYAGSVEVEIISGGMITGSRVEPVGRMAGYILNAIPRVERMTGIEFGEPYKELLKEGTYITSSVKPSLALCVFKSFATTQAVEYGHTIQTAFYKEARDLNQDELYAELAVPFGIDRTIFLERMKDSSYLKKAEDEFKRAADLGVTGFPCLLIKQGNTYAKLAAGYTDYNSIDKYLKKAAAH